MYSTHTHTQIVSRSHVKKWKTLFQIYLLGFQCKKITVPDTTMSLVVTQQFREQLHEHHITFCTFQANKESQNLIQSF